MVGVRGLRVFSRRAARRLAIGAGLFFVAAGVGWSCATDMPGRSHTGPLPDLTDTQRGLAAGLERDVRALASEPGSRSTFYPRRLAEAAQFIANELLAAGYTPEEHSFVARGTTVPNLQGVLLGSERPDKIVIVGAHFDSYQGTPGADDNASGVAATLALARRMAGSPRARTVRFVFFVNEEPPAFWTSIQKDHWSDQPTPGIHHGRAAPSLGKGVVSRKVPTQRRVSALDAKLPTKPTKSPRAG